MVVNVSIYLVKKVRDVRGWLEAFGTFEVTMNLDATPSSIDAAGHSGQNRTVRRSAIKLSKIARYSASLAFFVVFVLPEL